jgi:signal transduction histidine kinase
MELDLSTFDLPQLVAESSVLVRERAMRQRIKLMLDTPTEPDAWIGDARKLKQCVVNLLSNAVKFTPPDGEITVQTRRTESMGSSWAEITVSDTGIGISTQHQALVFEEFRQVRPDVLRKEEGTGLGLALVKRLVELHGGQVSVCSAPGQGSTFSMRLPRLSLEETG